MLDAISFVFPQLQVCFCSSYSIEHSGGQRVRLELQKLSQFSVFPGQVRNRIYKL